MKYYDSNSSLCKGESETQWFAKGHRASGIQERWDLNPSNSKAHAVNYSTTEPLSNGFQQVPKPEAMIMVLPRPIRGTNNDIPKSFCHLPI